MLQQIKELLQIPQVQEQVKSATNQTEAIKSLMIASAEKGYNFTAETISQVLTELVAIDSNELSEEDLLSVSGAGSLNNRPSYVYLEPCREH